MLKELLNNFIKHWYLTLPVVLSIISFCSVLVPPEFFWLAAIISFSIPIVLILNLFFLIIVILFKRKLVVFPLATLIFGLPFLLITYSFKGESSNAEFDFSVLSFNVKYFQKFNTYSKLSSEMINWLAADTSDIKCIQEYISNSKRPVYNLTKKLKSNNYNSFICDIKTEGLYRYQGMAIFTKYDIINSGLVWEDENSVNLALFIDIKIQNDTIRIYNIHLASMAIKFKQFRSLDNFQSKVKDVIVKLNQGAKKRSSQIDLLIAHTINCSYPFLICGDLNEIPYSYNYFKLKRYFNNSFEKAGNGFGFSLNSFLFFLRIDHHFYKNDIEAIDFRVDRTMKISDHFPTRCLYRISKPIE